jgi:hypothetical protein
MQSTAASEQTKRERGAKNTVRVITLSTTAKKDVCFLSDIFMS